MLAKTLAILISGKAGVGKSSAANFMQKYAITKGYNTIILPFAYGVKQIAYEMGWDGKKDEKGRALLIGVGMTGRAYDESIWAKYSFEKSLIGSVPDIILVEDWRFSNEGKYIQDSSMYQVKRVRVYAPEREMLRGTKMYDDPSENSLPEADESLSDAFYDLIILNKEEGLDKLKVISEKSLDLLLEKSEKYI